MVNYDFCAYRLSNCILTMSRFYVLVYGHNVIMLKKKKPTQLVCYSQCTCISVWLQGKLILMSKFITSSGLPKCWKIWAIFKIDGPNYRLFMIFGITCQCACFQFLHSLPIMTVFCMLKAQLHTVHFLVLEGESR